MVYDSWGVTEKQGSKQTIKNKVPSYKKGEGVFSEEAGEIKRL